MTPLAAHADRRRRSRSRQGEPLRHRAGDAELAVPHRLLHHRARIAGCLLRADERQAARWSRSMWCCRCISARFRPAAAPCIAEFGDDIAEGDAFLINHPYQGGSPHAPDMAVITPVFCRRRAVRLLRLDRAQERHRRPGAGKLLRPGARDFQRRPASAGGALSARRSSRSATSSASSPPTAARRSSCSATSAASSAPTGSASGG